MTFPSERDVPATYGQNRRILRGVPGPDPKWERDNLVLVKLPWRGVAAWDRSIPIRALRMHRLVADSLAAVLENIWQGCGRKQADIAAIGMDQIGGGYVWRAKRGGTALSMHAYGIAVDFDPARNGLGDQTPAMDMDVVGAFERAGWEWGGRWRYRDGMHFQAARA